MNFLVVTNAPTFYKNNEYSAYSPYVKEMNIWFSKVDKVGIVSPNWYPEVVFTKKFERQDIYYFKLPFLQFNSLFNFLKTLICFPYLLIVFIKAFIWADHIHLRCPGNMGLIGCMVQVFFPKKPKTVKFAGNWDPKVKQPWTYKLQKKILSNTFLSRNIKVLVYGKWSGQTKNILPFFTASFSEAEKSVVNKDFIQVYKFLFVGSLVAGKRPFLAIQLIEKLIAKTIPVKLEIYGDGILRKELEEYVRIKNLDPFITFFGNQKLEEVKKAYKKSHFLILASKSEGWPKAVAEAMFFGCIPVATSVSCVPWMLNYGSRGILISDVERREENREKRAILLKNRLLDKPLLDVGTLEVKSIEEIDVAGIIRLLENHDKLMEMSRAAQEWSQEYTLEKFEKGIQEILAPQPPKEEVKKKL